MARKENRASVNETNNFEVRNVALQPFFKTLQKYTLIVKFIIVISSDFSLFDCNNSEHVSRPVHLIYSKYPIVIQIYI